MKLYIKNMVSRRCKMVVQEELQKLGLNCVAVNLGVAETIESLTEHQAAELKARLLNSGLELIMNRKSILVERIKNVMIEMIHYSDEQPKMNYSSYISEKLNYDYTYLSNVFSEEKGITIQQYIIMLKIEKVKELFLYNELNLTEISHKLHYSSVAHLSNQFKRLRACRRLFSNSPIKGGCLILKMCDTF